MNDQDARAHRPLTRRDALALIGASGVALLAGTSRAADIANAAAPPACVVRPAQTEGPFFVDGELQRSDIRANARDGSVKVGVPLRLRFQVSQVGSSACNALAGVQVHVWHSDAAGSYSDAGERRASTASQQFLRGFQLTDATGAAEFLTIYPGWYQGRAPHIHFKLRMAAVSTAANREFTSQLYFDDTLSDRVYAAAPYAKRGRQAVRNADDFIFRDGGDKLLLAPAPDAHGGYTAMFAIGVQKG